MINPEDLDTAYQPLLAIPGNFYERNLKLQAYIAELLQGSDATGQFPATLGQKTMANSLGVAIASDQSILSVSRKFSQQNAVEYRTNIASPDVLSAPSFGALSSSTGGSLSNVQYGVSIVGINDYGTSERATVQTITPPASGRITIPVTTTGFSRFRIFLSTSATDPLFLAECSAQQIATGSIITVAASGSNSNNNSTLATITSGGTPGTIASNVAANSIGKASSGYQQSSAYSFPSSPDPWVNCAGYESIDLHIYGVRDGDFYPLSAICALFGRNSLNNLGYLIEKFNFIPGSDVAGNINSFRQIKRVSVRGYSAIALLIPVLQGTGSKFTIHYTLS